VKIREASINDLPDIVKLFHDDALGETREDLSKPVADCYVSAFSDIKADANNKVFVLVNESKIIGVMQLTFIPHLNRSGSKRGQIESVHIQKELQGRGLGEKLMLFALEEAKKAGCSIVQLTTDKTRGRACRYQYSLRGHWTATLLLWRLRFPQNVIRSLIVICPRYNNLLSASNIPGFTESFRPGWDKTQSH